MKKNLISRVLAFQCFALGTIFILCFEIGNICFAEKYLNWFLAAGISFVFGILIKCYKIKKNVFGKRERFLIISLAWLMACFLGALPYKLILHCPFQDAIFESFSGFTTTGATVFKNVDSFPKSLLLWRSLTQWMGGIGFIIVFVVFFTNSRENSKVLFLGETTALTEEVNQSDLKRNLLSIFVLYIALTLFCTILFNFEGMLFFDAICHAFTTLSTGGFSNYSEGIPYFKNEFIEWTTIIFMTIGGINFWLILRFFFQGPKVIKENIEFKTYFSTIIVTSILIFVLLSPIKQYSFFEALRHSFFQVTSIITTTGFHSCDFTTWPVAVLPILLILMTFGGCTGSTAGGFKIARVVVTAKIGRAYLEKSYRSSVVRALMLNKKQAWSTQDQLTLLHYLALNIIIIGFSLIIIGFLEPKLDFTTLVSTPFTCFFNIGPGFGKVGPTSNYAELSSATKIFLSWLMLLGRLEIYSLIVLIYPKFWKHF